jgi:hypothetical protein
VKHRPLKIPKDFDSAKEFVEIACESGLGVALLRVREQVDLRLFSLGLGGKTVKVIEEPVSESPRDYASEDKEYD